MKPTIAILPEENSVLVRLANDYPILQSRGWNATDAYSQCGLYDPVDFKVRIGCYGSVVTNVDLGGLGLGGTIPTYLGEMPWLQNLNLSSNNFIGTIPQEIANTSLRGNTNQLKYIYLEKNDLEGPIPDNSRR
jgi:hypothetical protein